MANKKELKKIVEELNDAINKSPEINNIIAKARRKEEKIKKITIIICSIVDIIIIINFLKLIYIVNRDEIFFELMFCLLSLLMIDTFITIFMRMFYSLGKEKKEYNKKFKEYIIPKLINNFYDRVEYFANKQMPERIYREANYEMYDIYNSDDYIEAKINDKFDIQMAEVHTKEEYYTTDKDGTRHREERTLFFGMFAKVVIDQSIENKLIITQNHSFVRGGINKLEMDSRRI